MKCKNFRFQSKSNFPSCADVIDSKLMSRRKKWIQLIEVIVEVYYSNYCLILTGCKNYETN